MGYNGYTNYKTWNVALWLNNDYQLYSAAQTFGDMMDASEYEYNAGDMYNTMLNYVGLKYDETPDGVKYADPDVNRDEVIMAVFG